MSGAPLIHLRRLQSVVRESTGISPSLVRLANCLLSEMESGLRFERGSIQSMTTRLKNWDIADGVILRHGKAPTHWPTGKVPRIDVQALYRIYENEAKAAGLTPFAVASFRIRAYELTSVKED